MMQITRRGAITAGATLAAASVVCKPAAAAAGLRSFAMIAPDAAPIAVPPLKLVAADGTDHSLNDFAGQGVVLNLWATWCIPCVQEMPSLAQLASQVQTERIAVVPLSSDRGGAAAVAKFYKEHAIAGLPIWLDPDGDAVHALKLRGIPTTLVIDRKGFERGRVEGAVDWGAAETVAKIKALVGQA